MARLHLLLLTQVERPARPTLKRRRVFCLATGTRRRFIKFERSYPRMDTDTPKRPAPKPQKLIIIFDGERPCFAAFANETQEKKILEILNEPRRKMAQ